MIKNKNNQKGQVLLIVIMGIAVLLTVVFTLSFTSRTDTQITKLQEDNQKALAAAEAGIEAAIKSPSGTSITIGSLPNLSEFSGSATVLQAIGANPKQFSSPQVNANDQFTFYLYDYPDPTKGKYNGKITVAYNDQNANCNSMALEITVITGNSPNNVETRYLADTGSLLGSGGSNEVGSAVASKVDGVDYNCQTSQLSIAANPKVMLVRAINAGTRIGFTGTQNLNSQGKYVNSSATGATGVNKKVQLFQSNPQIPSSFFTSVYQP